jgi:hypothetical protein
MYNNPYDHFKQQDMNTMYQNQMDNMQNMDYQMPLSPASHKFTYNEMPTMPMQPIQPMVPMGTVTGAGVPGGTPIPGTTSGAMPTNIGSIPIAPISPVVPAVPVSPIAPVTLEGSPIMDIQYTQGWLTTQIGQKVKVEFLIGTNMFIDREGTLVDVGISYIIINEVETDDLLLCDIYSIKFVRIYK